MTFLEYVKEQINTLSEEDQASLLKEFEDIDSFEDSLPNNE